MASVKFDSSVGGDDSIVTDDTSPTTGLAANGHAVRFVPALAQIVAIALWIKNRAIEVAGYKSAAADSAGAASNAAGNAGNYALQAHGDAQSAAGHRAAAGDFAAAAQQAAAAASAASGMPVIAGAQDANKTITVNSTGTGFELKRQRSITFINIMGRS